MYDYTNNTLPTTIKIENNFEILLNNVLHLFLQIFDIVSILTTSWRSEKGDKENLKIFSKILYTILRKSAAGFR